MVATVPALLPLLREGYFVSVRGGFIWAGGGAMSQLVDCAGPAGVGGASGWTTSGRDGTAVGKGGTTPTGRTVVFFFFLRWLLSQAFFRACGEGLRYVGDAMLGE